MTTLGWSIEGSRGDDTFHILDVGPVLGVDVRTRLLFGDDTTTRRSRWLGIERYAERGMPRGPGRCDVRLTPTTVRQLGIDAALTRSGVLDQVRQLGIGAALVVCTVNVMIVRAGAERQPRHVDHARDGRRYWTVMVPLHDQADRRIGGTTFFADEDGDDASGTDVIATTADGALAFRGDVWHCGMANESDGETRYFLYVVLAARACDDNTDDIYDYGL
jgi:hypothetical protein